MTYTTECEWLPANNFLFQIANVLLVLSYLCPPTLNGLIYLRLSLGLAGLFFALWGWLVLCALDTFVWNLLFFVGNFVHLAYIFYSRRVKTFSDDMEIVYEKLFKPINTLKHQFQYLTKDYETKQLAAGEIWAIDGVTQLKSLTILLEGKFSIRKHGTVVHIIQDCHFVNAPEWIMSKDIPYIYEVTIQAVTECKIISWERIKLLNILEKNSYLKAILDSVVSQDMAGKIFSMNRSALKSGNGITHSIYSLNEIGSGTKEDTFIVNLNNQDNAELSDEEKTDDNVKTKLLSSGYNNVDRETQL